jgi:hypothetical protein
VSKLIFGRNIRMQMVRAIPDVTCGSLRVGRSPKRYPEVPVSRRHRDQARIRLIATMNPCPFMVGATVA